MTWNKFWEYAKNTAKTIYILVLILFGIKLLCFAIFSLVPYKPFFPFETPDWNPIATLIGALTTFIAVFCTAKLDRDARKYENAYKSFIANIVELNNKMPFIENINETYIKYRNGDGTEINNKKILDIIEKIDNLKGLSKNIKMYSLEEIDVIDRFIKSLEEYKKMFMLIRDTLKYHKEYNYYTDYDNKIIIQHKNFIKYHNCEIDLMDETILQEIRNIIKKYLYIGKNKWNKKN